MNTNETKELLFPELSYLVTGICFATHNELGPYAREKQYGDGVAKRLNASKIIFLRECSVGSSGNITDFIIDNKIVLELKSKRILTKEDYYQTQRYLQETNLRLGLLVNFRNKYIKPVRVIRIDTASKIKYLTH